MLSKLQFEISVLGPSKYIAPPLVLQSATLLVKLQSFTFRFEAAEELYKAPPVLLQFVKAQLLIVQPEFWTFTAEPLSPLWPALTKLILFKVIPDPLNRNIQAPLPFNVENALGLELVPPIIFKLLILTSIKLCW